ncbi:hypothetical protein M514_04610 [Trichuris suis]|uniref:Uncharacterized protein n=1 Tax=Trichuris suis TaxID=68888 RepID=A0A085MB67_9BILA|nr:hypothetical protein M513_04610 [Trichuris suis]KFD73327.1 hypothetical protein M514_04610 [Trichuris suis]
MMSRWMFLMADEKVRNSVQSSATAVIIIRRTEEPTHHRRGHMMGINFHRQILPSPNVQGIQLRRRRMLTPGNWQVKFHVPRQPAAEHRCLSIINHCSFSKRINASVEPGHGNSRSTDRYIWCCRLCAGQLI